MSLLAVPAETVVLAVAGKRMPDEAVRV